MARVSCQCEVSPCACKVVKLRVPGPTSGRPKKATRRGSKIPPQVGAAAQRSNVIVLSECRQVRQRAALQRADSRAMDLTKFGVPTFDRRVREGWMKYGAEAVAAIFIDMKLEPTRENVRELHRVLNSMWRV